MYKKLKADKRAEGNGAIEQKTKGKKRGRKPKVRPEAQPDLKSIVISSLQEVSNAPTEQNELPPNQAEDTSIPAPETSPEKVLADLEEIDLDKFKPTNGADSRTEVASELHSNQTNGTPINAPDQMEEENMMTLFDMEMLEGDDNVEEPHFLSQIMCRAINLKTLPNLSNFTIDLTPEEFSERVSDMALKVPNPETAFIETVEAYLIQSKDTNRLFKAIVKQIVWSSQDKFIMPFVSLTVKYGMIEKTVSLLERLLEAGSSELFQMLINIIPSLGNEKLCICYMIFSEKSPDYPEIHSSILNAVQESQIVEDKVISRVTQYVVKFEPEKHFGDFIQTVLFSAFQTSTPDSCARWFYLKIFRHVYTRLNKNNPNDAFALLLNLKGYIRDPASGQFTPDEVKLAKKAVIKC